MLNYDEVKKHLLDELNDVLTYNSMIDNASQGFEKQFFRDIVKDEWSHARFMKCILDENSTIQLTDNEKELWNKAEQAVLKN